MRQIFNIEYYCKEGEYLCLNTAETSFVMKEKALGHWSLELLDTNISNAYFAVYNNSRLVRKEAVTHRFPQGFFDYNCSWIDRPYNFLEKKEPLKEPLKDFNICLRLNVVNIPKAYRLALMSSLDNWTEPVLLLKEDAVYSAYLQVDRDFEYKYVLLKDQNIEWELGSNRQYKYFSTKAYKEDAMPLFEKKKQLFGTAIPLFSLRSNHSFGIGDFNDLRLFIDYISSIGQDIIQLLPINNTVMNRSWTDSYPYSTNSSFALHPQYVHLQALGDCSLYEEQRLALNNLEKIDYEASNRLKETVLRAFYSEQNLENNSEYQAFLNANLKDWLLAYSVYSVLRDRYGLDFSNWADLSEFSYNRALNFYRENTYEVGYYCYEQYVLDRQLREVIEYAREKSVFLKGDLPIGVSVHSADVWQHPSLFNVDMCAGAPPDFFSEEGQNWSFPTYNWEKMKVDGYAWWQKRLKRMSLYFSAYRIDHVLGFFRIWQINRKWGKSCLGTFYPALPYSKEDLISLGFDPEAHAIASDAINVNENVLFIEDYYQRGCYHPRIDAYKTLMYKSLPKQLSARYDALYEDFFYKRHNELWSHTASERLPALLDASDMLACAEDLGMLSDAVPQMLNSLAILSLEIERMPKTNVRIADTNSYPYLSVASTGTHDTSTLRAWWEEDSSLTEYYYRNILKQSARLPKKISAKLAKMIVQRHIDSTSMLVILPLQDYLSMFKKYWTNPEVERINNPANPQHYWAYRMPMKIEDLLADKQLCKSLRSMISNLL